MYRHCTTDETVRRQRQLEQCLLELMSRKPYQSISVQELCHAAGSSRMAFYQYFDSKDDALTALIDHTLQDSGFIGSSEQELEQFATYWLRQKNLLDALHSNQLDELLQARALHLTTEEGYDLRRLLGIEKDESGQIILAFTVQGLISVIQSWHQKKFCLSAREIGKLLCRLLRQPLMISR